MHIGNLIFKALMKLSVKLTLASILIVTAYAKVPVPGLKPLIGRVAVNENIYRFALRLNVPLEDVKRLNGMKAPFEVYINQPLIAKIRLSPEAPVISEPSQEKTSLPPKAAPPLFMTTTPLPASEKKPSHSLRMQRKPWGFKNRLTLDLPEPLARSSTRFAWPVKGKMIPQHRKKDHSIFLCTQAKEPVKAAENGVVAFVGEKLRGLGCVILIKHADEWITTYGKIETPTVKRGDLVERGDIIGYVADRKNPKLLFELRHKTELKNPLDHLM